ncbi:integrase [Lysinibacillus sp. B2A1]|nr:integrase [Lysinibacillus sp. B2A1]
MDGKYHYKLRPEGLGEDYPPLLVFDTNNKPFRPLTEFYQYELGRLSNQSAISYLQSLLPYFNWIKQHGYYQGMKVTWTDLPEIIRDVVRTYLIDNLNCKVQEHYNKTFNFVHLTHKSPSTVRHFLSALKSFYNSMIQKKLYHFQNPLIDSSYKLSNKIESSIELQVNKRTRMPDIAGTEEPKNYRRTTNSYYKIVGDKWIPNIIDDISLPAQILSGGERIHWKLRDHVIARLLFETGARASEVVEVTIGDYRKRQSIREMNTFNKGSFGKRVKFLYFTDDTAILLKRYINSERKVHDNNNLGFNDLPDEAPLFLTIRGTPYTYQAWYPNWCKACRAAKLNINPHKTRHWYVTQTLRIIYETSRNEADIQLHIRELISYMNWKSKETIEVYEHYFEVNNHLEIQEQFFLKMKKDTESYLGNKKVINYEENLTSDLELSIEEPLEEFLIGLE